MKVNPISSYRFFDDGFPEASEYDSNYVLAPAWRRAPAKRGLNALCWLGRAVVMWSLVCFVWRRA